MYSRLNAIRYVFNHEPGLANQQRFDALLRVTCQDLAQEAPKPCLCIFDIDRTLTMRQEASACLHTFAARLLRGQLDSDCMCFAHHDLLTARRSSGLSSSYVCIVEVPCLILSGFCGEMASRSPLLKQAAECTAD